MKRIEAIIKPFKLHEIRSRLIELGVQGLTVTDVEGFGRQKGKTELYRGAEYSVAFVPKAKLEVVVPDDRVADVVLIIQQAARTGTIGDGKVFVSSVEDVVRIRTSERGKDAV